MQTHLTVSTISRWSRNLNQNHYYMLKQHNQNCIYNQNYIYIIREGQAVKKKTK